MSTRGDSLVVVPTGEGWLAVLAIDDHDTVAEVLLATRASNEAATVPVPKRLANERVLALLCPDPFTLAAGDAYVIGPSCIARDR
jgi:hypothetical protein